jgi:flagellar hook-associated protein 2
MAIAQFSGLASGIDSASLIDAIIEARSQTNEVRRKEIEGLESENESLDEFNTKLLALNDLLDRFRTINGGGVNKKSASSDSTVATAAVSAAASNSTLGVTVTSIASASTASFADIYTSTDQALAANASGTQTIGVDVGLGSDLVSVDVDITSSTTVAQFVEAFNSNANAAGRVSASLVNIGTTDAPSYRVVFNSLKEGENLGTIAFDIPTAGAGFGGNGDLQTRSIDQATDAEFSISGISGTITRATNAVSDVVSGVSFQISKAGTANITVSDDSDSTADLFQEIVDAYNDLVEFVNENNGVSRAEDGNSITNVFGSLAKASVDDDFLSRFRTEFAAASAASGTSVTAFSELGISTNRDGTLAFDIEKFKTAVGADPTGAAELFRNFADASAGTEGFIFEFTKFQGFIDIAQSANNTQVESLNDKISSLERTLEKVRANYEGQFSRLETLTSKLQSTQQALTGILAGLSA